MPASKGIRYPRTALRRSVYALCAIVVVMIIGIIGFHLIEGMSFVNALYEESMLATGQGPAITINTDNGKVFASVMAFVSVGSVITTLTFTLGPILSQLWREGLERVEEEARTAGNDILEKDKTEG
jgi:hypothetical protein